MENKKLKIGLFVDAFFPMVDGVINVVDNYAKKLSEYAEIIVFAPRSREKNYKDLFPYKVVRSRQFKVPMTEYDLSVPLFDSNFQQELKNAKLDIVHIHSPFTLGSVGVKYAKKHKIPVVATIHSQYRRDFLEKTKSETLADMAIHSIIKLFNQVNECWAVNHKVGEIFYQFGLKEMPKVQHNATDLIPFFDDLVLNKLREKYQIANSQKVFLFVGRLDKVKNLAFLIESLHELKKSNYQFKMLFIGSGPFEHEMKQMIHKYDLTRHVTFVGRVMDRVELSSYYRLSDLFLFPSLYDSSSLVQIEAASQNTPSLFLEGAATADTISSDINGYLAQSTPKAYAEKILDIFNHEKEYEEVCKKACDDLYITWQIATNQAYQSYLRVIENYKK
jgi:1,2-diacylglycerol 3-alpha-glucosyltransferase